MGKERRKISKKEIAITIFIIILGLSISVLIWVFFIDKDPPSKKQTPKPETIKEEKKLTIVDEDSNARPIAVMIDNNIGNGRHAGLQESYINYEIIVEGGLTRIMAVFKDRNVSLIGPVRSSRHYFLDYALESNTIYAHYGWSPYAQNDIKTLGVNNINGIYDAPFWRDTSIAAPHNVFTSTEKLYAYAKQKNYSTTTTNWKLLNYTTDEGLTGTYQLRFYSGGKGQEVVILPVTGGTNTTDKEITWRWTDESKECLQWVYTDGTVRYMDNVWVRQHYLSGELDGEQLTFVEANYQH